MSAAFQHTLAGPATLEGTSLHTGQKVTLTLKPAPEGHGFKFRRIDLPDQPFINADVDKVQTVERATTLAEGSVKVHTVEHVISALTGMGVDNALIEMDANEPPIGDGSSPPRLSKFASPMSGPTDASLNIFPAKSPPKSTRKKSLRHAPLFITKMSNRSWKKASSRVVRSKAR